MKEAGPTSRLFRILRHPQTSLFNVGGFYNPKKCISENDNFATMTVEFGAFNNRITKMYKIELHALTEER